VTRILVADDDPSVRSAIRRTLEAEHYEVEEATGGGEVLRLQQERPCDLLLIDLYMPGVDGLETIIRLKAEQPHLKIVALSGGGYRNKRDVLAMAVDAGASGALSKPFERTDLLAAVTHALGDG
jgi:CheY-like chemotaxis protein